MKNYTFKANTMILNPRLNQLSEQLTFYTSFCTFPMGGRNKTKVLSDLFADQINEQISKGL